MGQPLPYMDFHWVDDVSNFDASLITLDSSTGYILEVDLEYPQHLHDAHTFFCYSGEIHYAYPHPRGFEWGLCWTPGLTRRGPAGIPTTEVAFRMQEGQVRTRDLQLHYFKSLPVGSPPRLGPSDLCASLSLLPGGGHCVALPVFSNYFCGQVRSHHLSVFLGGPSLPALPALAAVSPICAGWTPRACVRCSPSQSKEGIARACVARGRGDTRGCSPPKEPRLGLPISGGRLFRLPVRAKMR